MAQPQYPQLRRDLTWKRLIIEGDEVYVIRDEVSHEYQKLDVMSAALAFELDGIKSEQDLLEFARDKWPGIEFDEDYIADLIKFFKESKLLEDPFQRCAMLAARAKVERAQIGAHTFKNLIMIEYGVWDPGRFLAATYPYAKAMFQPFFVWLGMALFALAGYIVWLNAEHVAAAAGNFFTNGWFGAFLIWLTITVVIIIHELGHAYAVLHYGGVVKRMGFMFYFGMPCMFCDTSDSHMFPERRERAVVALAGTYTELYVAALATVVWWATPGGSVINILAFNVILFASVSGIIFNYNPLIKLDGYFVLADWLEMPNLLEDSYAYLGYLFKRYVLRINVECPVSGKRRKRVMLVYGLFSIAYSVLFALLMFSLFRGWLVNTLAFLGSLLSLGLLFMILRRPIGPAINSARLWVLDHRGSIRRRQLPIVAGTALLVALFFLVPIPGKRTIEVSVQPLRTAPLCAPEALRLREVHFMAGQRVREGDVLVVLDAEEIASGQHEAAARAAAARIQGVTARLKGKDAVAAVSRARADADARESEWMSRRVHRAQLRAPFDGRVLTSSIRGRTGELIGAGDTLCLVGDFSRVRARAEVSESVLDDVHLGAKVRVRLRADPGRALPGRVQAIEPIPGHRGKDRYYRVWIDLDEAPAAMRAGLSGKASVAAPRRSAASHIGRWIASFLRLDLWV